MKCTKWQLNRPNDHKIYQHLSLQDTPKFIQIGIFVFKIYRLATLVNIRSNIKNDLFQHVCNGRFWYILWPFGLFTAIWHILLPLGIVHGHLVYFSRFGMKYQEKSGNPALRTMYPFQKAAKTRTRTS
jgi:hypothetical protein